MYTWWPLILFQQKLYTDVKTNLELYAIYSMKGFQSVHKYYKNSFFFFLLFIHAIHAVKPLAGRSVTRTMMMMIITAQARVVSAHNVLCCA